MRPTSRRSALVTESGDAPAAPAGTARLSVLHATLFMLGMVLLLPGMLLDQPWVALFAGIALAACGLLIWARSRIALQGPLGDVLRLALGRRRMFTMHLRAVLWLVLGALVVLWAVQRLRAPHGLEPAWPTLWARRSDALLERTADAERAPGEVAQESPRTGCANAALPGRFLRVPRGSLP